jgi:hypothetical protein
LYELKNTNSLFFEKNPSNLLVQLSSGSDDEGEKFFDVGVRRHHPEPDADTAVTFLGKKINGQFPKKSQQKPFGHFMLWSIFKQVVATSTLILE